MSTTLEAGDLERQRLREVNGFREAVQKTDDSLTLKPVEPSTEALYKAVLHEWDLYAAHNLIFGPSFNLYLGSPKSTQRCSLSAYPLHLKRKR